MLSYYLSKSYRRIKLTFATVGGLAAVGAIIYGFVSTGGLIYIIGGSVWLVQTGFNFFDSSAAVIDIKKQVSELENNVEEFAKENDNLRTSVVEISKTKEDFVNENKKLCGLLKQSEEQLDKLDNIKAEYAQENEKYKELLKEEKDNIRNIRGQNVVYAHENKELQDSLEKMKGLQEKFTIENDKLNSIIEDSEGHMHDLEVAKENYIVENEKLQKSNDTNKQQIENLRVQVGKLKELYTNSIELVANLRNAGDLFTDFNNSLSQNVVEIKDAANNLDETQENFDEHLGVLKNLVTKLKTSAFGDFDENKDGIITKEEFESGLKDMKDSDHKE